MKRAHLLIVIAAVLWGLDGILRRSLYSLPPIGIVFYEHLIGLVVIAPFFLRAMRAERPLARGEWLSLILVSALSGVLGTLLFTTALQKTQFIAFSVVFLLQKLQPIFAVLAARALLKERVTRAYAGWAALAMLAAYFVTFPGGAVNFATGAGTVAAALLAVGAAAAWGSSTAFSRYTLIGHAHTFVTGARFLATTVLALAAAWFMLGGLPPAPDAGQFARLLAIALSTGMVALWIYYAGLKHTEAKTSTILELGYPLIAVVIDIFLYDTVLAPTQYLAAAVLLFAAYRVSRAEAAERKA